MHPLLEVKNLKTEFITEEGRTTAVNDIRFSLQKERHSESSENRAQENQ